MIQEEVVTEEVENPTTEIVEDATNVQPEETPEPVGDDTPIEGEAETTPEDQFDFTYKVGKDQKEFPEFLRTAVSSKEHEEQLRDLFTKADGLPVLKEKLDQVADENHRYKSTWEQMGRLREEDPKAFLEAFSLPKESVLKTLSDEDLVSEYQRRKEFNELPEQARHQLKEREEYLVRERQMERQMMTLQEQQNQMVIQQFDMSLQSPQVSDVLTAYDSVHGEGAFRNQAIRYGDYVSRTTGRVASPQEVITAVMAEVKPVTDLIKQQQVQQTPVTQASNHQAPASIPQIGKGGATSPATKTYRSIDDIKKEVERRQLANG